MILLKDLKGDIPGEKPKKGHCENKVRPCCSNPKCCCYIPPEEPEPEKKSKSEEHSPEI